MKESRQSSKKSIFNFSFKCIFSMTSHRVIQELFYNWPLWCTQVSLVLQILTSLLLTLAHLPVPEGQAGVKNQCTPCSDATPSPSLHWTCLKYLHPFFKVTYIWEDCNWHRQSASMLPRWAWGWWQGDSTQPHSHKFFQSEKLPGKRQDGPIRNVLWQGSLISFRWNDYITYVEFRKISNPIPLLT